jgi:hypothetical protein
VRRALHRRRRRAAVRTGGGDRTDRGGGNAGDDADGESGPATPWSPSADLGGAPAAASATDLVRVRLRDDDFDGTLKRAVDEEAGVVLYAYGNGNAGGLAAIPIDQTRLGGD